MKPQNRPAPSKAPLKMSRAEKVLLEALIRGGQFASLLEKVGTNLPPRSAIFDLFEYPPAKDFARQQIDQKQYANSEPSAVIDATTDALVRSVVTESLMKDDPSFTIEDLQSLLEQKVSRIWARFSHEIKSALDAAEAKKDADLQSVLMKEYLDVQRKMKELNYFYDNKV
jgi:DNA-binding helix-hairpin-helix protein with protein kinase domain